MESIIQWITDSGSQSGVGGGSCDGSGGYNEVGVKVQDEFCGYGAGDKYASGDNNLTGEGMGDAAGYGYDDFCGYGSGTRVCGIGFSDGTGYGDCYGHGSGVDHGLDVVSVAGVPIFQIDSQPISIERIKGNVAKGKILLADLSFEPCYVVKQNGFFAHGKNLHAAMEALMNKIFANRPEAERIAEFWNTFSPGVKYPAREYFNWHYKLTGSCEKGRQEFADNAGIDLDSASFTPEEFIQLTQNSYYGIVIKKLKRAIPQKDNK